MDRTVSVRKPLRGIRCVQRPNWRFLGECRTVSNLPPAEPAENPPGGRMRVLLIEDDRRLARLVEQVLTEEGMDVDVAHDGEVGLEIAQRGMAQVAIIDWMLPSRDGPSICRALKAAHIP